VDTGLLFAVALLVMLIGLAGTVLPGLPGVPLVWLAAAGFGLLDSTRRLDGLAFVLMTGLAVLGMASTFWATQVGARAGGASGRSALAGSCLGTLALIVFSLPIAILAGLASVFGMEWRRRRDVRTAARSSGGWLAGCLLSAILQFALAALMIVVFIASVSA
jgi:uncharacterized protein YqgC (DUF456 family)